MDIIDNHLATLYTCMLRFSFIPVALRTNVFTAIPKAKKDTSSSANYRGISVAPVLFRILEGVLAARNTEVFVTDKLQYAYKKGGSCARCTHDLLSTLQEYETKGSSVMSIFLDASKAFDKVVHATLCSKLLERGMLLSDVILLLESFKNSNGYVYYGATKSHSFSLTSGVRQGSLLGGPLWGVYIDDLLKELRASGHGTVSCGNFTGARAYADDIEMSSTTSTGLQTLVSTTERYAISHQIDFNPEKSFLLRSGYFRPNSRTPAIYLAGKIIEEQKSIKYLGYHLKVNKRKNYNQIIVDIKPSLQRFFFTANSILLIPRNKNTFLRCRLLHTFALPYIDNCLRLISFISHKSKNVLRVAVGKVLRRALRLHPGSCTDLIFAASNWLPIDVRAGQLAVDPQHHGAKWTDRTLSVINMRILDTKPAAAAHHTFHNQCGADVTRICALVGALHGQDIYSKALAYNISVPTALNV